MQGLIYNSKSNVVFGKEQLHALVQKAVTFNQKHGITGYLYFDEINFLQYIEGQQDQIEDLMSRITNDYRHQIQQVIKFENVALRQFPTWSMHYLSEEELKRFKMEDLIISQLDYLRKKEALEIDSTMESEKKSIWRMVERLSVFHNYQK